jgi:hypothetical protein
LVFVCSNYAGRTAMHAREMIEAHPQVRGKDSHSLIRCIEECYDCVLACLSCADACTAEPAAGEFRQCIRVDMDCADVCFATGALATRRTGTNDRILLQMLDVCANACEVCAEECERHAKRHEHCRLCAESCRRCRSACRLAMQDLGGESGAVQTN